MIFLLGRLVAVACPDERDRAADQQWQDREVVGDVGEMAAADGEVEADDEPDGGEADRPERDRPRVCAIADDRECTCGENDADDCLRDAGVCRVEWFRAVDNSREVKGRGDREGHRDADHEQCDAAESVRARRSVAGVQAWRCCCHDALLRVSWLARRNENDRSRNDYILQQYQRGTIVQ
jgi:hypothetical protein